MAARFESATPFFLICNFWLIRNSWYVAQPNFEIQMNRIMNLKSRFRKFKSHLLRQFLYGVFSLERKKKSWSDFNIFFETLELQYINFRQLDVLHIEADTRVLAISKSAPYQSWYKKNIRGRAQRAPQTDIPKLRCFFEIENWCVKKYRN